MRNSLRLAAVGAALTAVSFASTANAAATATANANAEILSTLQVLNTAAMDFGQIAVNGADVLTVSADTANPAACPANLVCAGTPAPASFNVIGTAGVGVTASVVETTVDLTYVNWTGGGAAPTMPLNNFTVHFPLGNTLVAAVAGDPGQAGFNVGGDLGVAAGQAAGLYQGSFTVSVEYQ